MTFICTHNSRHSHMAQVWAQYAANDCGLDAVQTDSGGTEATAFNPRAVASLERAGYRIEPSTRDGNPIDVVDGGGGHAPMRCWSKVFDDERNPSGDFVAVITRQSADEAGPFVPGATLRVARPRVDPKPSTAPSEKAPPTTSAARRSRGR